MGQVYLLRRQITPAASVGGRVGAIKSSLLCAIMPLKKQMELELRRHPKTARPAALTIC